MKQFVEDATWDYALSQIQQPFFRLGRFDDAVESLILQLQSNWAIIMHWLIKKKFERKHKIPGDRSLNKFYEPLGELYYRILELCIQVHTYDPCGYDTAADWFARIITHVRNEEYCNIISVASGARETPTKTA